MERPWWKLLVPLLCGLGVEGFYHIHSMQTFQGPKPMTVPKEALFGFSIAYQPTTKGLIISAPNTHIGKIYECHIRNQSCLEIYNNASDGYLFLHEKMWLGATVAASANFTMACAPRYILQGKKNGTYGRCFATAPTSYNMTQMQSYTIDDKYKIEFMNANYKVKEENYMDTLGWSVSVSTNGSILVGGSGMNKGRAIEYSSIDAHPKPLDFTLEQKNGRSLWLVNFNFGYSVTSGNLMSTDSSKIVYAVSSTYGTRGLGLIILYNGPRPQLLPHPQINRPQLGAIFGAAMATASLYRGEPQSLLVGAPGYTKPESSQIDVGAIYIYRYNIQFNIQVSRKSIVGKINGGRFGSAIVSLGDLDGDDMHEIAVAAPYEGPGAVYIYSGANLVSDAPITYKQKISPAGYQTFGLSLVTLQDYDSNGCNELAIGAPESNKVVLLSCMASVTVRLNKLKEKRALKNETHFFFQACVDITKHPKELEHVSAEMKMVISITHAAQSAKLVNARSDGTLAFNILLTIRNKTQTRLCQDIIINMPIDSRERMIQYEIKATQLNSPEDRKTFDPSRVLLKDISQMVSDAVWLIDCEGKACEPKFINSFILTSIQTSNANETYIIGSSSTEWVRVKSQNTGDIAYSACMRVRIIGARVLRYPATCHMEADVLDCQPLAPVKKDHYWETDDIELDMTDLNSDSKEIKIAANIFPFCSENGNASKLSPVELTVKLRPDPMELILRGYTNIGNKVELTSDDLEETGKQMSHDYRIFNYGKTNWQKIICKITFKKESFFKVFELNKEHCRLLPDKDGYTSIICIKDELKTNQSFDIMLPIFIQPGTIDKEHLRGMHLTISSRLQVTYGNNTLEREVTSALKLKEIRVPLWVIIVAVLVGLLIIVIIIFALYECGFLRRQNKKKLQNLRRSVHRQSMRRSQIARESVRLAKRRSGERQSLIDNKTENETSPEDHLVDNESIPVNHIVEKPSPPTENVLEKPSPPAENVLEKPSPPAENVLEKLSRPAQNVLEKPSRPAENILEKPSLPVENVLDTAKGAEVVKNKQERRTNKIPEDRSPLKLLPEEDEECKIRKKEQIIRGLQKNLNIHLSNLSAPTSKEKLDE